MLRIILALLSAVLLLSGSALMAADEEQKPSPRHPSYQLLGHDQPPSDSPLNPNFLVTQESKVLDGTLWFGDYFPEQLVGLDVGDADGDGRNEIVYVTTRNLYLGRRSGGALEQLVIYNAPSSLTFLSVDFFDTDGDGRQEIIVSAQNNSKNPSSMIFSYTGGKTLNILAQYISWYLRVYGPVDGKILAAQKGGTSSVSAFSGPVYNASFADGKISTTGQVALPFGVNLFHFNMGSLGKEGRSFIATISPAEHLRLFSGPSKSDQITQKSSAFNSTHNHIDLKTSNKATPDATYLPSRIVIADIDLDGGNDIIVSRNSRSGVPSLKNLRSFDGGLIEAYKYANVNLTPFFTSTNILPGPAVDYQLADFDNNGTKDLVVGVLITQGEGMLADSRSIIISYSNLYLVKDAENTPAQ
jgi:hypothetical protein